MPYVALDDYRIYYEEQGQGPPLILLHNATGSTRDWRRVAPLLAAGGYRVISYDRRGFGRSDPLPEPDWSMAYLRESRDELLAFMDALRLDRAVLIGNSDGATIALLAAAQAPHRVMAVVAESPHMWYEKPTLLPAFEQFQVTLGSYPRFWRAMQEAHGDQAQDVVQRWYRRWTDPAFYSWNEQEVLPQIKCPVLIIHGIEDKYFALSHSQEIAKRLSNAHLRVYENAGHVPHLETAHAYAQDVIDFLKTIPDLNSSTSPIS